MSEVVSLRRNLKRNTLDVTVSLPYTWALGEVWTRFFEALKEKKILGSKCPQCGRVLVPARKFCSRCFVDASELVEVRDEGVLQTFTLVYYEFVNQPRKPPYGVGTIKLDGADTGFIHFIDGIDFSDPKKAAAQLVPGKTRLKAVWRDKREGTIFDIDYFKPI